VTKTLTPQSAVHTSVGPQSRESQLPRLVQFIIRWLTHAELSTCIKSEVPTFISTGSKSIDGSQNSVAMILYDTALHAMHHTSICSSDTPATANYSVVK